MNAHQQTSALADGCTIILNASPVRRPHLSKLRSRGRHDVGNAEAISDFDQLPTADDCLAPLRQFVQRQQRRRRVVVHGNAGFASEPLHQSPYMRVSLAALAASQIVLQVGVARDRREGG